MSKTIGRRELLVLGGAGLAVNGCVYFRGGALHEVYASERSVVDNGVLRIPQSDLGLLANGEALEVHPPEPYKTILIAKDKAGEYVAVTAECGHWGCTVDWAAGLEQWTCPCHGSRFDKDGQIVEGPADEPLIRLPAVLVADVLQITIESAKDAG